MRPVICSNSPTALTAISARHKLMLIELLWQIVLADGVVDDYEANLMRRVAGLIHVTDQQAGLARKKPKRRRQERVINDLYRHRRLH